VIKAAAVEGRITGTVLSAIGAEASPYHLANRLKSPQSLARKLAKFEDYYRRSRQSPEDVLRYTAAVKHPDELTEAAVRTIDRLQDEQWEMESAHHSYVDGSRYKGLHTFLRSHGERVELQVHSGESIAVKEQTTSLYEIERDTEQEPAVRDAARRECIALSAEMTQPAGIDDLKELGGVTVRAISYGKKRPRTPLRRRSDRKGCGQARTAANSPAGSGSTERDCTMTRLYLVKDGQRELWVAALVDEDVWTYVGNTGKFHRNDGARHDFYFLNELEYVEIGIAEAQRLIRAGSAPLTRRSFRTRRSGGARTPRHGCRSDLRFHGRRPRLRLCASGWGRRAG
jgi:hypothetical protein